MFDIFCHKIYFKIKGNQFDITLADLVDHIVRGIASSGFTEGTNVNDPDLRVPPDPKTSQNGNMGAGMEAEFKREVYRLAKDYYERMHKETP